MKNPKIPDSLLILIKRNLENQFDLQSILNEEQKKKIYQTFRQMLLDRWESFGYLIELEAKYHEGIAKLIADELKSELSSIEFYSQTLELDKLYLLLLSDQPKIQIQPPLVFSSVCFKNIRFYRKIMQIANQLELKETSQPIILESLETFGIL